ncbi:MAG TPA: NAD(P)/FAD-dependent oxidoreductase [Burkholderiaceae bacterium]|nr:NAD(P)/FAD-dependent oxidoreductase [Burkholderiaceae bacterium]
MDAVQVTQAMQSAGPAVEHFDVLIVGAGISGIDAAWHLQRQHPGRSFTLLETQESFGGTWLTHRYPGIRSDSDLFTFGYKWKPWTGAPIATADKILAYLNEVLDDNDLRRHIRYRHEVRAASWSSERRRWELEVLRRDTGQALRLTGNFLWMCQGYYRHSKGYTPEWPGMAQFRGRIVHPQTWPDDLSLAGRQVVVIGSGATAATLVPAIAGQCAHVTMLQRSPTYFWSRPNRNELADLLRSLKVPEEWTHEIVRRKILQDGETVTRRSFEEPEALRAELIAGVRAHVGPDFDVDTHFNPTYRPWRQRLALVPDGDLFKSIGAGHASVVTGDIERFTEAGILLESGRELPADIIVTATGFNLSVLGDIAFTVDGRPLNFADSLTWRGVMYTGLPNLAWVFGYFRASWTLRADLVAEFVCRLLAHMDEKGATVVAAQPRPHERDMRRQPFIDPENFNPGYLMRSLALMPKQGDHVPWLFNQDYHTEKDELPVADLEDGSLVYR